MSDQKDYKGRPIPEGEMPTDKFLAWVIEPAMSNDYDAVIIRNYRKAIEYAQDVVEMLMDSTDQDELRDSVTVTIWLQETCQQTLDEDLETFYA